MKPKLNVRMLDKNYPQQDGSVYTPPNFKFSKMVYRDKSFAGYDLVARRLWLSLTLRNPMTEIPTPPAE